MVPWKTCVKTGRRWRRKTGAISGSPFTSTTVESCSLSSAGSSCRSFSDAVLAASAAGAADRAKFSWFTGIIHSPDTVGQTAYNMSDCSHTTCTPTLAAAAHSHSSTWWLQQHTSLTRMLPWWFSYPRDLDLWHPGQCTTMSCYKVEENQPWCWLLKLFSIQSADTQRDTPTYKCQRSLYPMHWLRQHGITMYNCPPESLTPCISPIRLGCAWPYSIQ